MKTVYEYKCFCKPEIRSIYRQIYLAKGRKAAFLYLHLTECFTKECSYDT